MEPLKKRHGNDRRQPVNCEVCSKEILVSPGKVGRTRYCSRECKHIGQQKTVTVLCLTCQNPFEKRPCETLKYCSIKCRNESYKRRIAVNCLVCGKTFEATPANLKAGKDKYCSSECFHKALAEHLRQNPSNPRTQVVKPCEICGAEMSVHLAGKDRKRFCSKECLHHWQRTLTGTKRYNYSPLSQTAKICKWCGKEFVAKTSQASWRKFCSRQCQGTWLAANFPVGQTSIEKAVANLLDELGLPYIEQKQMGMFLCDFVLKKYRLAIECDGVYWHSTDKQKAKDERKDTWLRNHGYKILRLDELDIKGRIGWCKEQILAAINS